MGRERPGKLIVLTLYADVAAAVVVVVSAAGFVDCGAVGGAVGGSDADL